MNEILAQIELYINVGTDQENAELEELLATLDLDTVVNRTLQTAKVTQEVMLSILIADDATIQEMNQQYRQQNKPTDVLSFPLLDTPLVKAPLDQLWQPAEAEEGKETPVAEPKPTFVTPPELVLNLGDIMISWPMVQRQAVAAGHAASYELLYLLAHGVLHLVGYDDQSEVGYRAMVAIQERVLATFGQKA